MKLKANGSITINDLPDGTVYRVGETDIPDGYICSETAKTGRIASTETSEETFLNIYSAEGSLQVEGTKVLVGGSLTTGQFTFDLCDKRGTVLATATSNADGSIYFDDITFTEPDIYLYYIKERKGTDSTIDYDTKSRVVRIVVEDTGDGALTATMDTSEADRTITNKYKTGNLEVSKNVQNGTEKALNQEFEFTLTLKDSDGNELTDSYSYTKGDESGNITNGNTFTLKDGETLVIDSLPHGAIYEIQEADKDGFTLKDDSDMTGTITADETASVNIVNEYQSETEVNITAQKLLIGASLADYQFDFGIYDEDGLLVSNGTTDADGNIIFDSIYYNAEDDGKTNTYYVIESEGYDGIEYADSKELTVSIQDNGDGTMTATTSWVGGNDVFINSIATGSLPSAGSMNWQHVLLSLMLVGILLETAYVLSKKKYHQ